MMPVYSPRGNTHGMFGDMTQGGQYESYNQQLYQGGGFSFHKRHEKIDWRRLAMVDIEKVKREVDVKTLQDNVANIAFCDVENELSLREADANLVKLFKLAQLLIEYLLNSQQYLEGYIAQVESQIQKAVEEKSNLSAEIEKKNMAYRGLKKEHQKNKKLIGEYQLMLRAGASKFHKCPFCIKSFLNDEFLKAHILRRHSEQSENIKIDATPVQKNVIDTNRTGQQGKSVDNEELVKELSHITSKLQETEARLVAEREERDRKLDAEREMEFKKMQEYSRSELAGKDKEIADMKVLIKSHKDMFLDEIRQLRADRNTLQQKFDNLSEIQGTKPSMLGNLQDVTGESHHEPDMAQIKEQLQKELTESYQEQLEKVTRAARRREDQMKKVHAEELDKFSSLVTKYEDSLKRSELEKSEMEAKFLKELQLNSMKFQEMVGEQQTKLSKMEERLNTKGRKDIAEEETIFESNTTPNAVFASTPMIKRSLEDSKQKPDQGDSLREADANLVKLFKLAQLLIEYLLNSQQYLEGYIAQVESQIQKAVEEKSNLSAEIEKKNMAYRGLKKEHQKNKKLIGEYQLMLRAGASKFHKCPFCIKSFLNDEFLKAHILRRHSEQSENIKIDATPVQKNVIDTNRTGQQGKSVDNEELVKELSHITSKLQETEARLVAEREERDRKLDAEREMEFKKMQEYSRSELAGKDKEIADMKVLIKSHKDMFLDEIRQLRADRNTLQQKFDNLSEIQGTKPSMLGNLQDVTGESHHEPDMAQIKEQLQKELTESYQEQLEKVTRAARRREDQMKKVHAEELDKFSSLVTKYEDSLKRSELEKSEMEAKFLKELQLNSMKFQEMVGEQQTKLSKMEERLNTKGRKDIAEEETIFESNTKPNAVFASTPNGTIMLYVASNAKNNFRVWKTPSPSSSEWKDSFDFRAQSSGKGQFNKPIYVYYASGSPYWRQYVSISSTPPRSSYKLDFVFYVSTLQLMGTVKLFVLDAGSGDVVKSMISKSEIYPGWKQKGLSFFALKGPSSQNLAKSVSFQSTFNESELDSADDVSVSSYAATEDAKKDLAAAIARSREDLFKDVKEDIVTKEVEKTMDDSEMLEEEEEDATFDEADGALIATGSTSQWGSTLLQTGQFLPFPNNPLAVARYNHTKEMIDSCREEAVEILNLNLEKRGIDLDAAGMTGEQYESKMKLHVNEVNTMTKKRPEELAKRKRLYEDIDKLAREALGISEEPKSAEKAKSKLKSAVNKIKNASIFGRTSPRKKDNKESSSRPTSFINESFDEPPSPKTPKLAKSNQSIEELKPLPEPKSTPKQELESDTNDAVFDDISDNSQWESEESDYESHSPPGGTALLPKVTVVTKPGEKEMGTSSPKVSMREPRGEKVRDLAASLEARLFAREGIKKPTGAVDLHDTLKSEQGDFQQDSKPNIKKFDDDDDDDFDDFDLSSAMEDDYPEISPTKSETKRQNFGVCDIKNRVVRASYPKDNNELTVELSFILASSRPLPHAGSSSKLQGSQTAISKFTADDDFDNDSDLGL
eukprot:gene16335-7725_t